MNISDLTDEQILKVHQYYLTKYYKNDLRVPVAAIVYKILLGEYTLERNLHSKYYIGYINVKINISEYPPHMFRIGCTTNSEYELYIYWLGGRTVDESWLNKALKS